MFYYRLFFRKRADGPVLGVEEISARDDVEAVHLARERVGPQLLELWQNKRKVKRFAPVGDGLPFPLSQ
jgi:hypothetical protein